VYVGISLGVMPAQKLAQTRAGAKGAVLISACVPLVYFGPWPQGVPLQLHVKEEDTLGDVEVAREVASTVDSAELFLYPGEQHLFIDRSLSDYDAEAAALLTRRVLVTLAELD
jgi:dienelactone hydrolase